MPTFPIQPAIRRARVSLRPVRWLGLLCAMLALGVAPRASASATSYYVSPGGSDASVGTSINQPFRTIQRALDVVRPGDVVNLAAGVYAQDFRSRRGGTASAPITITGPSAAIVKGGGAARVGLITHDYLTLSGFTIDGLFGSAASASGYRDLLLEIVGAAPRDGVTGLKLLRMTLRNAGGTCVRLRSFAQHSEIAHSRIGPCGVSVFRFATGAAEGAGLAIGTAPEQRDDGTHPDANPDESSWNWVHDTLFDTQGGACVAIAAAATGNLVESNRCTG